MFIGMFAGDVFTAENFEGLSKLEMTIFLIIYIVGMVAPFLCAMNSELKETEKKKIK